MNVKTYKSILVLTCLAITSHISFLNAQWTQQNSGVTDDLKAISLPTADIGYIGGAYGLLLKTTDGGATWEDISTSVFDGYVSDIRFISQDTGYVHGWGGIFKTYNGGNTWTQVYTAPSWHYFAMDFWDEDHFTIVGREQVNPHDFWTTKTGISGWNGGNFPQSSPSSQYHDMQYLSADLLLALRFGGISKSTDGGDTWTYTSNNSQISENAGWNEFHFLNAQVGYIGASDYNTGGGVVYKTTDGGQTYTNVGATEGGIRAIHFINENIGFVGCEEGYIYKTEDGGATWFGEQHGVSTISDINFFNENIGAFVTESGRVYTTVNGGNVTPQDLDGALLETDLHNVLNLEAAPYTIKARIRNEGITDLNSAVLNYQIDGGAIESMNLTALSLSNLGVAEVAHSAGWSPSIGKHEFKIWIEQPNGNTDTNNTNDTLIYIVTVLEKALNNRTVLAEDATGAWCGWCPGIALAFDTLSSWYNTDNVHRFIPVAQHSGDWMETEESSAYALLWSGGAFPKSWYDRFRFFGNNTVAHGNNDDLVERLEERLAMDAPVNVGLDLFYNKATRELSANIDADFVAHLEGDYRVNCWIIEDGLLSNQANFYNTIPGSVLEGLGDPIIDYQNNHVLRTTLSDIWGDGDNIPTSISQGTQVSTSYSIILPADYVADNMHVVAFISEFEDKINHRTIVNATIKSIAEATTTASQDIDEDYTISVSPNPTDDQVNISYHLKAASKVSLEIFDVKGNQVLVKKVDGLIGANEHALNVLGLSPGVYLINIKTDSGTKYIKFLKH